MRVRVPPPAPTKFNPLRDGKAQNRRVELTLANPGS
jgi:hypothetical protein